MDCRNDNTAKKETELMDTSDISSPNGIHLPSISKEHNNSNKIVNKSYGIVKMKNKYKLVQIFKDRPQYILKNKILLNGVLNQPYSSFFELQGQHLVPIPKPNLKVQVPIEANSAADNRNLVEDQASQKLTRESIEELKSRGVAGEEIVRNLVENSTTFKEKTQFSQAKYLRKKKEKYCQHVQVLRPTTRLLAEMYFSQEPLKICNLRADGLAQMLSRANVRPGGKYLVLDTVQGLLVAAVLERTGGNGTIVQLYPGTGPTSSYRQAVQALNWEPERLTQALHGLSLTQCQQGPREASTKDEVPAMETGNSAQEENSQQDAKRQRRSARQAEQSLAWDKLQQKDFDGLLVASKLWLPLVVPQLLTFLAPSAPFALYSPYLEPLTECFLQLRDAGLAVRLLLNENWLRKYQVLSQRTHPEIRMSAAGGYLLTGIRAVPRASS